MNVRVSDIMLQNYIKVNFLDGIQKLQDYVRYSNIDFFPVYEKGNIMGLITYKDLIGIHPNRIVADVVRRPAITISYDEEFWRANSIFKERDCDILLVTNKEEIVGVLTKNLFKIELGKHIDPLTNLYKSSYIYYWANELTKREKDFSVLFIDINNFGYIDKKIGHVQGDEVIKALARILNKSLPPNSYLCRFAGDEFVILLPDSLSRAEEHFEYLRNIIFEYEFPSKITIEVSAGIINYNRDYRDSIKDDNIYSIMNRASLACTKAKKHKLSYVMENNKIISSLEKTC